MSRRTIGPGVSFFAFQDIITAVVGIFILITLTLILELNQRVESASDAPESSAPNIEQEIIELEKQNAELQAEYDRRLQQRAEISEITVLNRDQKMQEANADRLAAEQQITKLDKMLAAINEQIATQKKTSEELKNESTELSAQKKKIQQLEMILAKLANQKNQIKGKEGLLYRDQVDSTSYVCLIQLNDDGVEIKDAASKTVKNVSNASGFESWLRSNGVRGRHFLLLLEPSGVKHFENIREQLQDANAIYGFDLVKDGHEASLTFEWESKP